MKTIACVNVDLPTIDEIISYDDDSSLRDYDIVIFEPELPQYERIDFSGGGSCIAVDGTREFLKTSAHWRRELRDALAAGKTVFVILSPYEEDNAATGSELKSQKERIYTTEKINNYATIPSKFIIRNSRGKRVLVKDPMFKQLYEILKEIMEYKVVFDDSTQIRSVFTAKDGITIGGVIHNNVWPGHLVLIPYFDFSADEFIEHTGLVHDAWSEKALRISHALVGQLVAIDRALKGSSEATPLPEWLNKFDNPRAVDEIQQSIENIESQLVDLARQRDEQTAKKSDLIEYHHLLYETGKRLELAIEKTLRLMGYTVETLRIGDLEIDHVIVGPNGIRMIGESEGKDNSAIDVTKFRQLESNIGEDLEREEITEPAKGVLFGNGFRLLPPLERGQQFTDKSLKNAKRLGSALVRTADLYKVAVYILDNPDDLKFKAECRSAIEDTVGGIVQFPEP